MATLATHHTNAALGDLDVRKNGDTDVGERKSTVASRKNDDGTISFFTIDPTSGFEFVVVDKDRERTLVVRHAQHEYVFREEAGR